MSSWPSNPIPKAAETPSEESSFWFLEEESYGLFIVILGEFVNILMKILGAFKSN